MKIQFVLLPSSKSSLWVHNLLFIFNTYHILIDYLKLSTYFIGTILNLTRTIIRFRTLNLLLCSLNSFMLSCKYVNKQGILLNSLCTVIPYTHNTQINSVCFIIFGVLSKLVNAYTVFRFAVV